MLSPEEHADNDVKFARMAALSAQLPDAPQLTSQPLTSARMVASPSSSEVRFASNAQVYPPAAAATVGVRPATGPTVPASTAMDFTGGGSNSDLHAAASRRRRRSSAFAAEQSGFTSSDQTTVAMPKGWLEYGGTPSTVAAKSTVWGPRGMMRHDGNGFTPDRSVMFEPSRDAVFKIDLSGAIANPAPLGLFAFALTTTWLSIVNAGVVEIDFASVVWAYALIWGGLTQWLAGILEFFKKNTFGATVFCTYGAFWMGLAVFQILATSGTLPAAWFSSLLRKPSSRAGLTGFFACWGILTVVFFAGSLRVSIALASIFVPLTAAFFLLLAGEYSGTVRNIAGWFGVAAAVLAFYVGTATFLAEIYDREILPLGQLEWYWNPHADGEDDHEEAGLRPAGTSEAIVDQPGPNIPNGGYAPVQSEGREWWR